LKHFESGVSVMNEKIGSFEPSVEFQSLIGVCGGGGVKDVVNEI